MRNGAKSFARAVRAGDAGAAEVVREFHPRLGSAHAGSPELDAFKLADAQLVVARRFGFASWPKLKAHLELVERYARAPHELVASEDRADEFLRLACLTYAGDDGDRLRSARAMLNEDPAIAGASIHTAAATGDVEAARGLLAGDSSLAVALGGPHGWEPLLYVSYSRVAALGGSSVGAARLLLDHGADPNAGYLWEGLTPPFTALTGCFGHGENDPPPHPDGLALARLLLERGADPNDGQTLYNCSFGPGDDWLELLFEFGLGRGDGGPWKRLLGDRLDTSKRMLEDLLMQACGGRDPDRVRLLLEHGVDPDAPEPHHPIHDGRSPVQQAAVFGSVECLELLAAAGARGARDPMIVCLCAATAGDRDRVAAFDAALVARARSEYPAQVSRAADRGLGDGVALLIEIGFDVNAFGWRATALHEAAWRGDLPMIEVLLAHGADPNLRDSMYNATPAGWAQEARNTEAMERLRALER
jgi:hypothetical protein